MSSLSFLIFLLFSFDVITYNPCNDSVLLTNVCSINCSNQVHTLCASNETRRHHQCKFTNTIVYDLQGSSPLRSIKSNLILSHNGLRHRIAGRMNVSNMLALRWDNQLEEMAKLYARQCQPWKDDVCAHMKFTTKLRQKYFQTGSQRQEFVVQNRYCLNASVLPYNFDELVLREWYAERFELKAPTLYEDDNDTLLYQLVGENNFTHLAHDLTHRFGCAIVRYNFTNFCLHCFYYPYFRLSASSFLFDYGAPNSECPLQAPLISKSFNFLCTCQAFSNVHASETLTLLLMMILINGLFSSLFN